MKSYSIFCQNPSTMINPYTREKFVASCGKCPACLGIRHQKYISMMETERKKWKYAFFCTLTYSDAFIPKLYFTPDKQFLVDKERNKVIPYDCAFDNVIDHHWFSRKAYFEYSDYSDFQRFLKRLRMIFLRMHPENELKIKSYKYIEKDGKTTAKPIYETFSYYGVSEYGPFTVRPHFHCIIYFNSPRFARTFEQSFYKAWSVYNRITRERICIGERSACRPTQDDSDAYTAAYCDAVVGLPALYKVRDICPRHSYSRQSDFGYDYVSYEEKSQYLYTGAIRRYSGTDKNGKPVVVPYSSAAEYRIFPKCPQFSRFTTSDRVRAYLFIQTVSQELGFWPDYSQFRSFLDTHFKCVCRYFPALSPYLSRQWFKYDNKKPIERPYYQLFLSSKRFIENCENYGLDAKSYCEMIVDYYSLKEYYRLTDWLAFVEEYSKYQDYRPLYSLHLGVSDRFKEKYSYFNSVNYRQLVDLTNKMHNDRTKSKKERDYQARGNAIIYEPEKYKIYG